MLGVTVPDKATLAKLLGIVRALPHVHTRQIWRYRPGSS